MFDYTDLGVSWQRRGSGRAGKFGSLGVRGARCASVMISCRSRRVPVT